MLGRRSAPAAVARSDVLMPNARRHGFLEQRSYGHSCRWMKRAAPLAALATKWSRTSRILSCRGRHLPSLCPKTRAAAEIWRAAQREGYSTSGIRQRIQQDMSHRRVQCSDRVARDVLEKGQRWRGSDEKKAGLTFSRVQRSFGGKVSASRVVQLSTSLMERDCV